MRKFLKPIEIDKELEEDFDLSDERGWSAADLLGTTTADHCNDPMQSTMEDDEQNDTSAHNTDNRHMPSESYMESQFDLVASQNITDEDFDDQLRLKIKLEQLYQSYCDAKKRQAKWNDLDERVSKSSSVLDERIPSPIADLLRQSRKDAKGRQLFQTNTNTRSKRSFDEKLRLMTLLSILRSPEEQPSVEIKKNFQPEPLNEYEDSQQFFANTPAEYESKYASQFKLSPKPVASTAQIFASSTPHKLLNDRRKPTAPIHSPIVGLSHTKQVRQKTRINKDDPKWYLKYLGLDSISDLFSDDDDNEHNVKICDKDKSGDQEVQLFNNLNKSICGNESLVEEQSQYTVTRILKICEDAERERKGDLKPSSDFVTPRRKRLYIGSVDDLFCDDDDEDDHDLGGIIASQVVDVALSSSNDTINYDVDDALSQHKNSHHSTNMFKDTIEGETSHHLFPNAAAKTVANTKSDELFSTYNETVANSSKMTVNCTKNSTPTKNQSSPRQEEDMADESIPATPPKCSSSNIFAYFSRSPSVLIKASSILSTNNHNITGCLTGKANDSSKSSNSANSDKSSTSLSFKLSALNSQLVLSKHFNDFDEIKENFDIETNASPFATCQTSRTTYQNRQRSNSPDPSPDTFATCQSITVKLLFSVKNQFKLLNFICNFIENGQENKGKEKKDKKS